MKDDDLSLKVTDDAQHIRPVSVGILLVLLGIDRYDATLATPFHKTGPKVDPLVRVGDYRESAVKLSWPGQVVRRRAALDELEPYLPQSLESFQMIRKVRQVWKIQLK